MTWDTFYKETMNKQMTHKLQTVQDSPHKNRFVLLAAVIALTGLCFYLNSCKEPEDEEEKLKITGVSIPSSIDVVLNGDITLTGKGFAVDDEIHLALFSDPDVEYISIVVSVTEQSVTFSLPDGIQSGWKKVFSLAGAPSINANTRAEIPELTWTTIPPAKAFCRRCRRQAPLPQPLWRRRGWQRWQGDPLHQRQKGRRRAG